MLASHSMITLPDFVAEKGEHPLTYPGSVIHGPP
jgi:hypothetical protein